MFTGKNKTKTGTMTAFNAPPALLFLDSTVNSGKKETLVCCESDSPLFSVK